MPYPSYVLRHPLQDVVEMLVAQDPTREIQGVARQALEDEKAEATGEAVDRLARVILEWFNRLLEDTNISSDVLAAFPTEPPPPYDYESRLTAEQVLQASARLPPDDFALSEALADRLGGELGTVGGDLATTIRADVEARRRQVALPIPDHLSADAWRFYQIQEAWRKWTDGGPAAGTFYPWPGTYVIAVARALLRAGKADVPQRWAVYAVERDGDSYAQVDKRAGGFAWAFGGTGALEVAGDVHAMAPASLEPTTRVIYSRSWDLIPKEARNGPQQTTFPVALTEGDTIEGVATDGIPLIVSAAGQSGYILSSAAGKLAVLVLAGWRGGDEWYSTTLGDLTGHLKPGAGRIQKRDFEDTARGLWELRRLYAQLPNGNAVNCFDVEAPVSKDRMVADQPVAFAVGRLFQHRVLESLPWARGSFVMNLSGAMRLDGRTPGLLRSYMRACALWNNARVAWGKGAGRFRPGALPWFTEADWAAACNLLSARTVDFLASRATGSRAASRVARANDLRASREHLEALQADGLLMVRRRRAGRDYQIKILPPDPLLKAWEDFRSGGGGKQG